MAAEGQVQSRHRSGACEGGKLAVVTGANKGIGFHIAEQLRDAGLRVVIACRSEERGMEAAKQLGVELEILDVAFQESIDSFCQVMMEKYGYLDVLVNNAAIAFKSRDPTPFQAQTEPTLRTNFYGTVSLTDQLLPLLRHSAAAGRQPRIVNVASMAGRLGQLRSDLQKRFASPRLDRETLGALVQQFADDVQSGRHRAQGWGNSNYGMSKLALIAYTRMLAREEGRPLLVNACCPGWCRTDMSSHSGPRDPALGAQNASMLALLPDSGPTGSFVQNLQESSW